MDTLGLRERKKQRTRTLIADTAARLFAEHGYEHVAVSDVARAAEVSEPTVYNYFPTKERLVLDRDEEISDHLTRLIKSRSPGVSPAAAIRHEALGFVEGIRSVPTDQLRGGLGYLGAISPTVRRMCLEMTDRLADAIAVVLAETTSAPNLPAAKVHAVALAWVFQTITDETGRRIVDGRQPTQIADELRPIIEAIIDDLDGWLKSVNSID
ncbi:MAG: TetR/AcrR family transcriptional regulator [Acidimicrobiales bacterium]|jgi:AcrR family transcriptional regulator